MDRRVFRKELEVVGAMQRAGVRMIAGTDVLNPFAFPGFSLHDELALLVAAGLTPMEALQTATLNAAAYLGQSAAIGTIEAGKAADLVLLDANPIENIANTKRIAAVVAGGRLLERRDLDGLLMEAERIGNLQSISETLSRTIESKGVEAAVKQYRNLKQREPNTYDFSENELNTLGYSLLKAKKVDEAIEILRLNTEMFSGSGGAFDSLGEAYMIKGDRERAIANYKRSLELDPRSANAVAMLKKLGGL
jgi:tetratricopeptide (TPR) repeat protein